MKIIQLTLILFLVTQNLFAQQLFNVYSDAQQNVTGTWEAGTLVENNTAIGTDGIWQYKFDYEYFDWWAGIGLNLDNWGGSTPLDFTPYTDMKIGFRLTSPASDINVVLQDREGYYNEDMTHTGLDVTIDVMDNSSYIEATIPLSNFVANSFDLSIVSEIDISVVPDCNIACPTYDTGTLFIDYIRLVSAAIGQAPTVTLTTPNNGNTYTDFNPITITATASDPNGTIEELYFYINDQPYYADNTAPYTFDFVPWDNGIYEIKAVVKDNDNNQVESNISTITINNPSVPASTLAQTRAATIGKGVNLSSWLEASWVIQFNDPADYTTSGAYIYEELVVLKAMGANTIRFPILFEWFQPSHPLSASINTIAAYAAIDNIIEWTEELGLNLILVNHHGINPTDSNWESGITDVLATWTDIISRYGDTDPDRVFFELKNEPHNITQYNLRQYQQPIIEHVRSLAPNHTLIVGGGNYNAGEELYRWLPYNDNNLIYTYHNYQPFCFVNQLYDSNLSDGEPPFCNTPIIFPDPATNDLANLQALHQAVADWSTNFNVPVFCGEFGVNVYADAASRCNYWTEMGNILASHNIPWTYWGWRNADINGEDSEYGWFVGGNVRPEYLADDCVLTSLGFNEFYDNDNDGFYSFEDCDDENPSINPDAIEIPNNNIDENCDGLDSTSNILTLEKFSFQVIPNPATNFLRIDCSVYGTYHCSIYDSIWENVYQSTWQGRQQQLPIEKLNEGLYFILIKNENSASIEQQKFIKIQ